MNIEDSEEVLDRLGLLRERVKTSDPSLDIRDVVAGLSSAIECIKFQHSVIKNYSKYDTFFHAHGFFQEEK